MIPVRHVLLSTLLGLAATAAAAPEVPFVPTIPIMDVDDLRPGMKGYGLSVFEGTEPRRFSVTIRGVLKDRFADGDMIIIESDDPIMQDIGGIAGMSGSPIFIDDKLIGAFAYGWGFSVRPINGVTPIKSMLKVMEQITREPRVPPDEIPTSFSGWGEARAALSQTFPELPERRYATAELARMGVDISAATDATTTFHPLGVPLMVSTRSAEVMKRVEAFAAGTSLRPVMSGLASPGLGDARGADRYASLTPVNGGAFAVVMCEGDLSLAGLGTTTYVQGDRVIAFGHPMYGEGAVDYPVAVGEVVAIIPSVMRPFKIGNAVKTVGALRQDRLPAVGASLSAPAPRMIPVRVAMKAPEIGLDRDFNYRVAPDRRMAPMMILITMLESMESVRYGGPMAVDFTFKLTLADGRVIERREFLSGEGSVGMMAAIEAMFTTEALLNNPFKALSIASVETTMNIGDRMRMQIFDKVVRDVPPVVYPGDTVRLDVEYTRWRQEPVKVPIQVTLPATLRPGNYQLHVGDGRQRVALEYQVRPDLDRIESVDDLVRSLRPFYPMDRLYVTLVDSSERPLLNGQPLAALPASVAAVTQATMRGQVTQGSTKARIVQETTIPRDAMVLGSTSVTLNVQPRPR